VALVELARHGIFFTNAEVEITSAGLNNLSYELLEHGSQPKLPQQQRPYAMFQRRKGSNPKQRILS